MSAEKRISDLAKSLIEEGLESTSPDPAKCLVVLEKMGKDVTKMSASSIESSDILKLLMRASRSFKRHKRTSEQSNPWGNVLQCLNKLLDECKATSKKKSRSQGKKERIISSEPGQPSTVVEYRARLVIQKKDIYKDPPVLPRPGVQVESSFCPMPKRNKKTGLLSFTAMDPEVKKLLTNFQPNLSPEEVLRAGAFGGTYFRPIVSAVTNVQYNAQEVLNDTVEKEWIKGLPMNMLSSKTYRAPINKFGVKCGGSLGMWESSGWIVSTDPYGWFQWYCRFYRGRRCDDDARQISRWLKSAGPKGRFRSQLCNKIHAAGTSFDDTSISPVIRQTLWHWGLVITPDVFAKHLKRVGR